MARFNLPAEISGGGHSTCRTGYLFYTPDWMNDGEPWVTNRIKAGGVVKLRQTKRAMLNSPPSDKDNNEEGDGEQDGRNENGGRRGRAVDGNLTFSIAYLLTSSKKTNKKTNIIVKSSFSFRFQ